LAIQKYRKKILLISIVVAAAVLLSFSYYLWCVGGILGYVGGKLAGGKTAGVKGRVKSIIFPLNKYQLHLHHWFIAVIILIVTVITDRYVITPQLFYGGMLGLAFQGVYCYDDWFHIIKKRIH
jgi:hypothetical protein